MREAMRSFVPIWFFFRLGVENVLGKGVASEICAENNENEGDGNTAALGDGAGNRVSDEGTFCEEKMLKFWD